MFLTYLTIKFVTSGNIKIFTSMKTLDSSKKVEEEKKKTKKKQRFQVLTSSTNDPVQIFTSLF